MLQKYSLSAVNSMVYGVYQSSSLVLNPPLSLYKIK